MAHVLVTGAEGCIGAWVTKQLLEAGHDVLAYDLSDSRARLQRIAPRLDPTGLRYVLGHIEDTAKIKAVVRGREITHVVHLAAVLMPYCQANPVSGALINVVGTLNVFEAARDAGRPVRIAYASSSAVWGPEDLYENRKLNEQDSPLPTTHYGIFKHANEGSARIFAQNHGIASFGLRPWTVYGPGRDTGLTAAPSLALQAVARGESYTLPVSGPMDLQYVEDVAASFVACLFAPVSGAHVCNLAGDIVTMEDFIGLVDEVRPGARNLLKAEGPRVPVATRMDDSLLRSLVPGIQRTPLREGIARSLAVHETASAE